MGARVLRVKALNSLGSVITYGIKEDDVRKLPIHKEIRP